MISLSIALVVIAALAAGTYVWHCMYFHPKVNPDARLDAILADIRSDIDGVKLDIAKIKLARGFTGE